VTSIIDGSIPLSLTHVFTAYSVGLGVSLLIALDALVSMFHLC
jgi:hypothetical protein